jgi:two-component system phosphate regulon sensor histidine kinase PhoR
MGFADIPWPTLAILGLVATLLLLALWWRGHRQGAALTRLLDREREEKRALSARLEQFAAAAMAQREALLNSMADGALLLDETGRVRMANAAFARLFQIRDDLRGRKLLEAVHSHELDELARRARESGPVIGAEFEVRGPEPRTLLVNASAIANDRAQGMILVFHDLTRLNQLEAGRREFVANVSHELRNPLSLIKGYVETLLGGAKDNPDLTARFLQTIARNTDRLTYLIEDLLTLSRLESGRMVLNLHPTELRELAARLVEDFSVPATARRVTIQNGIPTGLSARADADRVQQILSNLLDNAIKYGREGGEVALGARDTGGGFIELWVRDDGPGIPPTALGRVFERFYRVDKARSRDQGGTGLGLAIVRHITQSHGGEVRVESELGKGATFFFTLPKA